VPESGLNVVVVKQPVVDASPVTFLVLRYIVESPCIRVTCTVITLGPTAISIRPPLGKK
jgi:hypothetical protein